MNRRTDEEDAVDVVDARVRARSGTHPLRAPGAGRRLYAAGLVVQLAGLLGAFTGLLLNALDDHDRLPLVLSLAPLAGVLLQVAGQRLCARAWWHVPLRSPDAPPDAVEVAFWSTVALAVAAAAVVVALVPAAPEPLDLWLLLGATLLLALLPEVQRPGPEPPAPQAWRTGPLVAAAAVVLGIGVGAGLFGPAGVAVALALLAGGLVAQRTWLRHRYGR